MSTLECPPTKVPLDTAVRQQRMKAWTPILHPVWVILTLIAVGAAFVPLGLKFQAMSDAVVEYKRKYDSYDGNLNLTDDCGIDIANQGKNCTLTFNILDDMEGAVMVYYEIENFHQNHREYETSRDDAQLLGSLQQADLAAAQCDPLNKLGNITLNPCGLIANTFFNDVIKFVPGEGQTNMMEEGIAWTSDLEYRFRQPQGFESEECVCDTCSCAEGATSEGKPWSCDENNKHYVKSDGTCHKYYYPNEEVTQYLHETYPMISPLEGVTDEHFVVWMRIASHPTFRKFYGYFENGFKKGDVVTFVIENNWIVKNFKGSKSLVITTTSAFGGKTTQLGGCFIGVGGISLLAALFFGLKHIFKPRKLADEKYLKYKAE
mmetsp:Transcript_26104/g.38627  ORF Transcript_26104/g.38627 Transcript_26104/m.38627 type:complete len:376 (-) Transcript_26104:41-1168(-)